MCNRLLGVTLILLTLLYSGCASKLQEGLTPTRTPPFITATLSPTGTQLPSETPLSPPSQPTTPPVEGVTSTQVNVRAEPSTASQVLGTIPPNTKVEITGKDPGESWWQINYPQEADPEGKGWVAAQYVTAAAAAEIPTIGGDQPNPEGGSLAIVQQQLNVRSGPGTDFSALGTLNPQDVVSLTGKDPQGAWLQIEFPPGPEGKGWVNAAFVQAQGADNLPIVAESGVVIGTGTPTTIPLTATPTIVPAWEDRDSASDPIASVVFEPAGTQTVHYNGDLSFPQGDSDDWIAFRHYDRFLYVSLDCRGSSSVRLELLENEILTDTQLECGMPMQRIAVKPGSNYVLHIQALPSTGNLQYTSYTVTIKTRP